MRVSGEAREAKGREEDFGCPGGQKNAKDRCPGGSEARDETHRVRGLGDAVHAAGGLLLREHHCEARGEGDGRQIRRRRAAGDGARGARSLRDATGVRSRKTERDDVVVSPGGRGGDEGAGREDGTSRAGSRTGLPVLVGHVRRRGVGARRVRETLACASKSGRPRAQIRHGEMRTRGDDPTRTWFSRG